MSTIRIRLDVDKESYAPGEPVVATLSVRAAESETLAFPSSQRYDFALEDHRGVELWRWSEGRMFAQMMAEEELAAGQQLVFRETVPGPRAPGQYVVVGTIPAAAPAALSEPVARLIWVR